MMDVVTGTTGTTIPPSPWVVQGTALVIIGRLNSRHARDLAGNPHGLVVVPGFGTIAMLGLVHYADTPVGPYHEVAVCPGVLWRTLPGALISHMLVDSARSRLAGRALWGLPKELAHFDWQSNHITVADQDGQPLLDVGWQVNGLRLGAGLPFVPVATLRGPRRQLFATNGWLADVRRARVTLAIPPASPLAPLASLVRGPHLALAINRFRLRISAAVDLL